MTRGTRVRGELFLNGAYRDITSDILQRADIIIDHGLRDEDLTPRPSTCQLTLENTSGNYSIRNPLGLWQGYLGRNNPFRLWLDLGRDTCTTTASNGWGTTDTTDDLGRPLDALTWSVVGTTSNYSKSGGKATHSLAAAGDARISYLADVSQRDVEVRCTVTVPTSNVTGAGLTAANIILHGQGAMTAYYLLRLVIQTDESITVDFQDHTGASLTGSATTVPGITHTAAQALRVAFAIEGTALHAKVWAAASSEPFAWTRTFVDEDAAGARSTLVGAAGSVGIRSSLPAGNTNGPIVVSYDDIEIRHYRHHGEVATWPATTDSSGKDSTVSVVSAGVRRRKSQGQPLLDSPLRRYLSGAGTITLSSLPPRVYWPLEDRSNTIAGEVIPATGQGQLVFQPPTTGTSVGRITWAGDDSLPGSSSLPTLTGGGSIIGECNPPVGTTEWFVTFVLKMNTEDGWFGLLTTATAAIQVSLVLDPVTPTVLNGYLTATGYASTLILSHTFADQADAEDWHHVTVSAIKNGTGIDFLLDLDGTLSDITTVAALTVEALAKVQLSSVTDASHNTSVGHLAIFDDEPISSELSERFYGNTSETAGQRIRRLCVEESVPLDWRGTLEVGTYPPSANAHTARVGPQRAAAFLSLLDDAARLDAGLLFETRGTPGLSYRTRRSLYTQTPWVTLDYSASELARFRPEPDDRLTRNRVRARRDDGGDYTHEVDTGPLSSLPPEEGGAGTYESSLTVPAQNDIQLPGVAEWATALGTIDEDRYPDVMVRLVGGALDNGTSAHNLLKKRLLDLNVGDVVAVSNARTLDLYDTVEQIVIGYREVLNALAHTIEPVLVPASPYRVWTIGSVAAGTTEYARVDSDATTLAEDLDTTETGVDVAIAAGKALWTTNAADWPFDVITGGERMTVTVVSGSSSPQTFTVTRSVNNVVRNHSTGQKISLARPNYLGL